jgi:Flp pilus assembly pilin Flp
MYPFSPLMPELAPTREPSSSPQSPLSSFLPGGARSLADETGAATAEYVITTMAAVAFAGLLVVIMRSDEVKGILLDLVRRALNVG